MKEKILITPMATDLSETAEQTPINKTRSDSDYSQVDNYLVALKCLGIPTSHTDNLDAPGLPQNTVKIIFNTTLGKLRVYNPVTETWADAGTGDLANYLPLTGGALTGTLTGTTINAEILNSDDGTNSALVAPTIMRMKTGANEVYLNSDKITFQQAGPSSNTITQQPLTGYRYQQFPDADGTFLTDQTGVQSTRSFADSYQAGGVALSAGKFAQLAVNTSEPAGNFHVRGTSFLDASSGSGGVQFYGVAEGNIGGINIGSAAENVEPFSNHYPLIQDVNTGLMKRSSKQGLYEGDVPVSPTGEFIYASPTIPQNADININGTISTGSGTMYIGSRQMTFDNYLNVYNKLGQHIANFGGYGGSGGFGGSCFINQRTYISDALENPSPNDARSLFDVKGMLTADRLTLTDPLEAASDFSSVVRDNITGEIKTINAAGTSILASPSTPQPADIDTTGTLRVSNDKSRAVLNSVQTSLNFGFYPLESSANFEMSEELSGEKLLNIFTGTVVGTQRGIYWHSDDNGGVRINDAVSHRGLTGTELFTQFNDFDYIQRGNADNRYLQLTGGSLIGDLNIDTNINAFKANLNRLYVSDPTIFSTPYVHTQFAEGGGGTYSSAQIRFGADGTQGYLSYTPSYGSDRIAWNDNFLAYQADLNSYLPLSGGYVNGDLTFASSIYYPNVNGGDYNGGYDRILATSSVEGFDGRVQYLNVLSLPFLPLSGGTLTGNLDINEGVILRMHAADTTQTIYMDGETGNMVTAGNFEASGTIYGTVNGNIKNGVSTTLYVVSDGSIVLESDVTDIDGRTIFRGGKINLEQNITESAPGDYYILTKNAISPTMGYVSTTSLPFLPLSGGAVTGDVEITDTTKGIIMKSPNGTRYRITINDAGDFVKTAL